MNIESYRITYEGSSAWTSTGPIVVTFTDGEVVSAIDQNGNTAEFETVAAAFNLIRQAIDNDVSRLSAHFDPETGYPTSVRVDPFSHVFDEEYSLSLSNLEIL